MGTNDLFRRFREDRRLTVEEFAARLGCAAEDVIAAEAGPLSDAAPMAFHLAAEFLRVSEWRRHNDETQPRVAAGMGGRWPQQRPL